MRVGFPCEFGFVSGGGGDEDGEEVLQSKVDGSGLVAAIRCQGFMSHFCLTRLDGVWQAYGTVGLAPPPR